MEIEVLKSFEQVVQKRITEKINIELPTENKFYKMNDDGRFFPRGIILFAILPRYTNTFNLFVIERGKQDYNDFVPSKDCRQDYWLDKDESIRRTALSIITKKNKDFKEITKEEFIQLRDDLLNAVLNEAL